jgi:transketolase
MNNYQNLSWDDIREMFAKTQMQLEKSSIEFDRRVKKSRTEFDKDLKKSRAEFDKEMKEWKAENEKNQKAYEKRMAKYEEDYQKRMGKMEENMGNWSNNHGSFAEEYFFNSFENKKQNFFGEKFDEIEKNVKGIKKNFRDEYDIMLINGKSVGIVESKFKAHLNDLPKVLRKAKTLKINFPEFNNHKIYLGLATLAFYPELEQECIEQGIAIIKQVGDNVVIHDAHLKTF